MAGFDYASEGAYFVTICIQNRECLLVPETIRTMVKKSWDDLSVRFPQILLDEFVIMPNHIHGIVFIMDNPVCRGESCIRPRSIRPNPDHPEEGDHKDRPYGTRVGSIGRMIQAFKSITTHHYTTGIKQRDWPSFQKRLWQRNYYERIIRNDEELNHIRQYIRDNPKNWHQDPENIDPAIRHRSCRGSKF